VLFPEGLEAIGERSFEGSGVVELALPDSVRVIRGCAFGGCERLRRVTFGREQQQVQLRFQDMSMTRAARAAPQGASYAGKVRS
jgi:hypothetical protein